MPLNFYNQTIELQLLQFETLFSNKCKNYITYLLMKYKYNIAKKYANSILFLSMYTYEKQFSNIWSTIQNGPFLCWFLVLRINVPCLFFQKMPDTTKGDIGQETSKTFWKQNVQFNFPGMTLWFILLLLLLLLYKCKIRLIKYQ